MQNTSWEKSSQWYNKIVGDEGHYFHQSVIFPNLKKIINFNELESVLDLACGQGIFERQINSKTEYVGVDIARSLIEQAKKKSQNQKRFRFIRAFRIFKFWMTNRCESIGIWATLILQKQIFFKILKILDSKALKP